MPPQLNTLEEIKGLQQKNVNQPRDIYTADRKKYKFLIWEFETRVLWAKLIIIILFHLYAVYCLLTHRYTENPGILLYLLLMVYLTGFGITAGAHRYFTHRSYKANLPLRIFLLFCYSMAGQNSLKEWVRDHRVHHKFSETNADPHNSRRGFFFSHIGWLMMRKHQEVLTKGQQVDCSDLFEDPLVVFHQRYFIWIKIFSCFILPTIVPPLVWGESWAVSIKMIAIVRYTLVLNDTWSVNSAAHLWGYKPYDKNIFPSDNKIVSVISMGEGYHNYHHTFPWDYRTAERGSFWNFTTLALNFFEKIGWAYDLKSPSLELVKKMVENHGDGSHYRWGHEITEERARNLMKAS